MSKTAARLALLCAVVGLVASGAAAYVHYHILRDPAYTSFCDVSASVNCTEAYTSRFGTFRGIPVAVFGGIWFAFALLLAAAALMARKEVAESVPGYLFAGSTLALAVVLYLAYASFAILKVVCVLCLTTYAAVIGLFLITGAVTSIPMMSLPRRALSDLKALVSSPVALVLAVAWFGGAASALAFFPRDTGSAPVAVVDPAAGGQGQQTELERFMSQAPRVPLVISAEGAKILIVKFHDFQCPACRAAYLDYKPIFAKYQASNPGAIRVVEKDFPLNTDCNNTISQTLHPSACDAAVAVRLAREHNRGDQMEEWCFTHQEQMTPQTVRQAAHDVGGVNDFDAQYASAMEGVKADIALAKQLHVTQTPTFFINGVKVDGEWRPQLFDQAIAYELAHAK
jgi:uncharacterized membrane protein/predicted DsbA family dithiol-disulfide isomerase